jgi:hypothetical protein
MQIDWNKIEEIANNPPVKNITLLETNINIGDSITWGGKEYAVTSINEHNQSITLNGSVWIDFQYFFKRE